MNYKYIYLEYFRIWIINKDKKKLIFGRGKLVIKETN